MAKDCSITGLGREVFMASNIVDTKLYMLTAVLAHVAMFTSTVLSTMYIYIPLQPLIQRGCCYASPILFRCLQTRPGVPF